ncbi:hypothetical protein EYF80_059655 [Liparis tanakae]|uniref:Uncharacterized protein n=1 Tax=Liparis tanakae TaxID=230148 RepID=A0A4Z2EN08_9TELE|nr:hypothetical protein EYF80_059655 [Liparis tanakae]
MLLCTPSAPHNLFWESPLATPTPPLHSSSFPRLQAPGALRRRLFVARVGSEERELLFYSAERDKPLLANV